MRGDWRPMGVDTRSMYGSGRRPEVGDVVGYEYRAWKVMHVSVADLTPDEADRINAYVESYRDRMMPYRVTLRRLYGAKHERENDVGDMSLRARVGGHGFPTYPNGRVPLCSCHTEPWPCIEADQQAQAEKELKAAEEVLNLLPGCCPACGEPVTSRQQSITFGGPNVMNPLAEGPTYHLRRKCRHGAARYEESWVKDEPGRLRSLLTLKCAGTVIVHGDGSAECFGADDSDCPSVFASHRGYCACYATSHGCPRDCPRDGHPGAHPTGYPSDPRSVTA